MFNLKLRPLTNRFKAIKSWEKKRKINDELLKENAWAPCWCCIHQVGISYWRCTNSWCSLLTGWYAWSHPNGAHLARCYPIFMPFTAHPPVWHTCTVQGVSRSTLPCFAAHTSTPCSVGGCVWLINSRDWTGTRHHAIPASVLLRPLQQLTL